MFSPRNHGKSLIFNIKVGTFTTRDQLLDQQHIYLERSTKIRASLTFLTWQLFPCFYFINIFSLFSTCFVIVSCLFILILNIFCFVLFSSWWFSLEKVWVLCCSFFLATQDKRSKLLLAFYLYTVFHSLIFVNGYDFLFFACKLFKLLLSLSWDMIPRVH